MYLFFGNRFSFLFLLSHVILVLCIQLDLHGVLPRFTAFSFRPNKLRFIYHKINSVMMVANPLIHKLHEFEFDTLNLNFTLGIIYLYSRFGCFHWFEYVLVELRIEPGDALTTATPCRNFRLLGQLFVCLHCFRFLTNHQYLLMFHIKGYVCALKGGLYIVPYFHFGLFSVLTIWRFVVKGRRDIRGQYSFELNFVVSGLKVLVRFACRVRTTQEFVFAI